MSIMRTIQRNKMIISVTMIGLFITEILFIAIFLLKYECFQVFDLTITFILSCFVK
jgi:hypothetical protein